MVFHGEEGLSLDSSSDMGSGFEGPEKNLELDFRRRNSKIASFLSVSQERWSEILSYAQCSILSRIASDKLIAYLLSESSLFVFDEKIILKTCGRTTLLRTIPSLLALAEELDFCVDFVRYSRPFFLYPSAQTYPHDSFDSEVQFLEKFFRGHSYTLGAMDGKTAWHLYVADQSEKYSSEQTFEIIMFDLDSEAVSHFFKSKDYQSGLETLEGSGLKSLLPCEEITRYDAYNFDPCGFSLNVVNDDIYYTIHITPESHCSYASLECNAIIEDFTSLLMNTLKLLKPKKYCVVFFADSDAPAACVKQPLQWSCSKELGYQQFGEVTFVRMHENFGEYCAQVCSFMRCEDEFLFTPESESTQDLDVKFLSCSSNGVPQPLDVLLQVSKRFGAEWFSSDHPLETKLKKLKSISHRPLLFIDLGGIYQNFIKLQKVVSSSCRYSVRCNPDPAILRLLYELGVQLTVSSRSEVEHLIRNDISLSNVVFCSPMLKLSSVQRILKTYSFGMVTVSEDVLEECISKELSQILREVSVELSLGSDEFDTSSAFERLEYKLKLAKKLGLKIVSVNISQLESEFLLQNIERLCNILKLFSRVSVVVSGSLQLLEDSSLSRDVDCNSPTKKLVSLLKLRSVSLVLNADSLLLCNNQMMAVSVIARQESSEKDASELKVDKYYISEGVFGAFHELLTESVDNLYPYPLIERKSGEVSFCSIYGPSGDCLDHIWSGVLPVLDIHDYIFFPKIGSFLSLGLREFNDFSRKVDTRYLVTFE
ncbi:S-adenosylmethionine decarboxylase isoform 1 [Galdieria sulphuraria]|uniref:adenosylmethionine decarboxylase n=1 Tax=Galdieria sulphuraria TaxID=130081 RepID=M2YAF1_GALSU|nr:S-adenosylmethionine decarboxylase isoform 2 [Galdieria sulphuraria]XP_005709364.1 S-adenosylmethionine decarboxylase isoform 1 [Galdieria sulphuraria]EME32843.1 S-adenosylmethionine decarboxylase isoform 2 [Galdieria sulphuraria]EME32844.1 S-adenosylmethionine decarboxylase isoform 1 [Galdieria sulphuraria]|eukprot:XP_005709363.1 S-adenosylmethionine decarboxylase isoform 2 [Galdieria sulphuraria]